MLALVSVLVVAALAAPLTAAQAAPELEAVIEKPDQIKPEVGGEEFDITFTYVLDSPGYNIAGNYKGFVPVTVSHNCAQGVQIEGPAKFSISVDGQQTQGNTHTHTVKYYASATREAKGLTNLQCTLTAQGGALQQTTVPPTPTLTQPYFVTVGYYDSLSVNVQNPIQRAAPQREISFTLSISNFGNADTRVLFSIPEGEGPNKEKHDWNHVLPTAQVIPTAVGGANNVLDTTFTVTTPAKTGWNNILDGYTIQMSPQAEIDSSAKGTPITATVLVRVRGVYVPGFEAVAVIGGLLGAVALVRSRRDEE